ncbi:hypothetical protein NE237_022271 [Protea cynaroides]|uniref:Uncharacterized protein n=1 Tax=Protea cynaroides TaxID=273540 RepID=A0A9Q0H9F5_9MAGN|nr:hypothetical protein NE237_022271 [Protea cynaroides]
MASEEELQETNPICQDDVPLLTKESYMTWKDMMEKFLKNQGLWGYVDGTIHELDQDSSKDKESPLRKIFIMKCEAMVLSYIEGLDIRHIWGQLVTMYEFCHPTNPGEKMKRTHYTWCWPFYKAIVDGDWKTVSEFLSKNKGALSAIITTEGELPLHVALRQVQNKQRRDNLAKELIKNMSAEDLSKQNKHGRTALHIAASDGNLKIVKAIVEKDKKLVTIQSGPSSMQTIPIMVAASAHKKNVVDYLYPITKSQEANRKEVYPGEREKVRASLLNCLIWNNFYGLAFDLIHENPSLVLIKDMNKGVTILTLSIMPSAFPSSFSNKRSGSGMLGYHFQKFIYSCKYFHH